MNVELPELSHVSIFYRYLRLPEAFLSKCGLAEGSRLRISDHEDGLLLRPDSVHGADSSKVLGETVVGKRGIVRIPRILRKNYTLRDGHLSIIESDPSGILVMPAVGITNAEPAWEGSIVDTLQKRQNAIVRRSYRIPDRFRSRYGFSVGGYVIVEILPSHMILKPAFPHGGTPPLHGEMRRIGKHWTVALPCVPERFYRERHVGNGWLAMVDPYPDGLHFLPAWANAIDVYPPERMAQLLFYDVEDENTYQWWREEVLKLGMDPDTFPHTWPTSETVNG